MRTQHNIKSTGTAFARQTEAFEPEMACFREPAKVVHVLANRHILSRKADLEAIIEFETVRKGAVPVFHFQRREVCMDFCLHGVLGERISS